ncbi:MAG: 1,4-beta-xylanase [Solirubrobacterales bacterium]|nr:1,4-beta-xylanase [Solirubrobacterales bacterium]
MAVLLVVGGLRQAKEERGPGAVALPGMLDERAGDRLIGTAVDDGALQREPGYREVLARQFSTLTPENAMKWAVLEPERGRVEWGGADRLVAFAEEHDQEVRGHPLVWFGQLPGWVEALPEPEVQQVMREHIRQVVERYRGRVRTWDVVNEPFEDDGSRRRSIFQRGMGDGWVEDAFRTARTADPDAKLYLNEIGAEAPGPKSDALYALARDLRARGVPIDGVGFQGHFNLEGMPRGFRQNVERFAALGLDVAITEADVALEMPASEGELRAQAAVFRGVVEVCRAVPRCRSLTFWGFTDRHSWIPATQPGRGAATLLDEELRPKPAFRSVLRALGR